MAHTFRLVGPMHQAAALAQIAYTELVLSINSPMQLKKN
jgi:hypothetical protein